MSDRWYFKHAGQIYGPVSGAQLSQLASQGRLLATDLIWAEGTPATQAVPAQAALSFPSKPGTVTQLAPPAQEWLPDVGAPSQAPTSPLAKKAVPDWLSDVERAEENAGVPLAAVAPPSPAAPASAKRSAAAVPIAAPVTTLPPQAEGRCRYTVGSASTRGMVRDRNEDSLLVQHWTWGHLDTRHELALLAIADGMGGHGSGDKASAIVIRTVAGVLTPVLLRLLQGVAGPPTAESLADDLTRALRDSNRIVREAATQPGCKDMGATVALVLLWENQAVISHVGDCRVYHWRGSTLTQLTRDHTLVERMLRLGQLSPKEAATHPRRNEVDQAVGSRAVIEPSRQALALQPGDWLLVCCDGLYAHVDETALQLALKQASSPPQLAYHLIDRANQGGGSDNCTVIAVQCY